MLLDPHLLQIPGVAGKRPHVVRQVFGVQADETRPVHPLDQDHHVVLRLHDRLQVVVDDGPNRHRDEVIVVPGSSQ